MPLVFTQNEATVEGHEYADELGVAYEYPIRYRNLIRPGEPFVYYRGRRRAEGRPQPQVYLGVGVVGDVRPSSSEGRLICSVEDFEPFAEPVPFKLDGTYLEPLGNVPPDRAGLYFRQGVRSIDETTFGRILAAAAAGDPTAGRRRRQVSMPYASPETARLVDEIAIELARRLLGERHGETAVHLMPHNNPGYDIRVATADGPVEYVEVKGTTRAMPHFYMSEGERLFSVENASRYTLLVVYGIDVGAREGSIYVRVGALSPDADSLRAVQWEGVFSATETANPPGV